MPGAQERRADGCGAAAKLFRVSSGRRKFIGFEWAESRLIQPNRRNAKDRWGIAPQTMERRFMPIYRFRILDKLDRVIAGQYSYCSDDDAARRHADILAARTRRHDIAIWQGDRLVPREVQDVAASLPRAPYQGDDPAGRMSLRFQPKSQSTD